MVANVRPLHVVAVRSGVAPGKAGGHLLAGVRAALQPWAIRDVAALDRESWHASAATWSAKADARLSTRLTVSPFGERFRWFRRGSPTVVEGSNLRGHIRVLPGCLLVDGDGRRDGKRPVPRPPPRSIRPSPSSDLAA